MSQEPNDVPPAIRALLEGLRHPEAPLRLSAAQALGEQGEDSTPAVGPLLGAALHDADPAVRLESAVALARIARREEAVVPLLVRALKEGDEARRWIAADRLREIGPAAREAVMALLDGLCDSAQPPLVRQGFALALRRIIPEAEVQPRAAGG
jgi:HEAT repeat protein